MGPAVSLRRTLAVWVDRELAQAGMESSVHLLRPISSNGPPGVQRARSRSVSPGLSPLLQELVREGKVRYIGVSETSAADIRR